MSDFSITLRGHATQADKLAADYLHLPFDLPFDAAGLRVRYRYSAPISSDHSEGGNVIDIGLFDPRGADFPGGAGFRGWSGSARSEFAIQTDSATPGYTPGPLPAGRYRVILGLYRIWEHGADYAVEIEADRLAGQAEAAQPARPTLATVAPPLPHDTATQRFWLRGDLQSHTFHSDAKGSPQQLTDKARALGLDFLAVTDHNTVSHHADLARLAGADLLLIAGQESTTYYGHMNIWGTSRWCDFRARSSAEMAAIIDLAHQHGALCSINHPKTGGPAWTYDPQLPVDAMEVWQGPWPHHNDESLALWDHLLLQGRRLPGVGGSDYHCPAGAETNLLRLGQPTTWVQATQRTTDGVLEAIRAGRVCISAHPHGPRLVIEAHTPTGHAAMGETLAMGPGERVALSCHAQGAQGQRLRVVVDGAIVHEALIAGDLRTYTCTVDPQRYVRCELVADMARQRLPAEAPAGLDLRDWRWALSNPVYVAR